MNRGSALAVLLALTAAIALRVPHLALRPLHNDEGVNAVKVAELWEHGRYVYDPDEFHGPTLYYASLPFLWLSGARNPGELHDAALRVAPVAFGVALVLLLWLLRDGLGLHATTWAAFFVAVSPAMVFYSRYFIHEMLLVFFSALTLGALWRYWQSRSSQWAVLAGVGVGLMFATKETFIITIAAMVGAAIATALWTHSRRHTDPPNDEAGRKSADRFVLNWRHVWLALGSTAIVWLLFFSSFFTNFQGLQDSVRTYLPWLKRAGGNSPHIHPWHFYLQRLAWFHPVKGPIWSEGLILILAAIGGAVSLAGKKSLLHRFIAFYTLLLTAAYCAIGYKTPWCLLNFSFGMILLAGVGAAVVIDFCRRRNLQTVAMAILAGATGNLAWQAWRASFVYFADQRNPYVYAQTVPDILNLVDRVEGIARAAPGGFDTAVKVIAPDSGYWPLPWYLRRFQHVGWYEKLPADPFAPVVVVASKLDARLDDRSDRKWIMAGLTELRPGKFFELYVELDLWKKYVATLPRPRD